MTTTRLQVRVPTPVLGRWLLRSGVMLPVPLTSTYAAQNDLEVDDVLELVQPRIAGSASPASLEGIEPHVARVLERTAELLVDARAVGYAMRAERGEVTTVAGIVGVGEAMLLVETRAETTLRPVNAEGVAEAMTRALPPLTAARLPDVEIPETALASLSGAAGTDQAHREDIARRSGVAESVIEELLRVQATHRALGITGCTTPDGDNVAGADWVESSRGTLLKKRGRQGHLRFAPCDRAALARELHAALTAV